MLLQSTGKYGFSVRGRKIVPIRGGFWVGCRPNCRKPGISNGSFWKPFIKIGVIRRVNTGISKRDPSIAIIPNSYLPRSVPSRRDYYWGFIILNIYDGRIHLERHIGFKPLPKDAGNKRPILFGAHLALNQRCHSDN